MIDVTCIIPARGNSKRLPRKNILPLNGKPLIAYSIEAWNKSKYYHWPAIVSTEDEEIAGISTQLGARVIKRPVKLCQDDTPTIQVIQQVYYHLQNYDRRVHWILILQPTSPLRTADDIDSCLAIIERNEADSLSTICDTSKYDTKENGAIYICHANQAEQGKLQGPRIYYYSMPPERSIDIDTIEDLQEAEIILNGGKVDNSRKLQQPRGEHRRSQNDDIKRKTKRSRTG